MASAPRVLPGVGDRGSRNGLRPPHVREAGVAASGRPFSENGLDSHRSYALCRADDNRLDPRSRQGPAYDPRRGPRPSLLAEPRRKSWRNETGGNSDAATVATAGTATVGGSGENVEGGDHHHRRGGDSGGGSGGGSSGAGVAQGAVERATLARQRGLWPQLWRR